MGDNIGATHLGGSQPLVYVHGAGAQKAPRELKQELDRILFGREMPTTRIAYYADVRWPPARPGPAAFAPSVSGRARREGAIRLAARPEVDPEGAAASIVAAAFARPALRGRLGVAGGPLPVPAVDAADALRLATELYRYADLVASRSSAQRPGTSLGPTVPDPIFRLVVGRFASDVIDYLYGGFAEQIREPVRRALLEDPPPKVLVAHSMGTIVLYDVLSEPAFAGLDVDLLVTAGCPLGIGNVQNRLRNGTGRPNPVPRALRAWVNFADRWDPVALEATLRDEFDPPKGFATDETVNNRARNNHDLTGYLSVAVVRSTIVNAAGQVTR